MILITGMTLGVIGKVLLGVAVIRVHWHVAKEHNIDGDVVQAIRNERAVAMLAIAFIVIGYVLELAFFYGAGL